MEKTPNPFRSVFFIIPAVVLLGVATACVHIGFGATTTVIREVKEFSDVHAATLATVSIVSGPTHEVSIICASNLIDLISTEVDNGILVISQVDDRRFISFGQCEVLVSLPALRALKVSGTAAARLSGTVAGSATVERSGTGSLDVEQLIGREIELLKEGTGPFVVGDLQATGLFLRHIGTGRVEISGSVEEFTVQTGGPGAIKAMELIALDVTVGQNGGGPIEVNASSTVTANITSDGAIHIHGAPAERTVIGEDHDGQVVFFE